MSDLETARIIALSLLGGDSPPEEAEVRRKAEIAVQAVVADGTGAEVDIEVLVRELEANLNVVVGIRLNPHGRQQLITFPGSRIVGPRLNGSSRGDISDFSGRKKAGRSRRYREQMT